MLALRSVGRKGVDDTARVEETIDRCRPILEDRPPCGGEAAAMEPDVLPHRIATCACACRAVPANEGRVAECALPTDLKVIHMSIPQGIHISTHMSIHISTHMSEHISTHMSIELYTCL